MATKQEMLNDFQTKSPEDLAEKYHIDVAEAKKLQSLKGQQLEDRISKFDIFNDG